MRGIAVVIVVGVLSFVAYWGISMTYPGLLASSGEGAAVQEQTEPASAEERRPMAPMELEQGSVDDVQEPVPQEQPTPETERGEGWRMKLQAEMKEVSGIMQELKQELKKANSMLSDQEGEQ